MYASYTALNIVRGWEVSGMELNREAILNINILPFIAG
jgi:hypothetical protein